MELVEVAENEWVFRDPALTHEIESRFNDALDAYDDGDHEEAEALIRAIVGECPTHIDALHHLGMFLRGRLRRRTAAPPPPRRGGCAPWPAGPREGWPAWSCPWLQAIDAPAVHGAAHGRAPPFSDSE